jgi:hypothetical protein
VSAYKQVEEAGIAWEDASFVIPANAGIRAIAEAKRAHHPAWAENGPPYGCDTARDNGDDHFEIVFL